MKTVHVNKDINPNLHSYYDFLNEAKMKERLGNFKEALMLYLACIKMKRGAEFAYNRIMIIYRKQKELDKERRFILDAIKVFEVFYQQRRLTNSAISR